MIYEPKVIFNPNNEEVEFMCGSKIEKFKPGEKRLLDGFVAYHALTHVRVGLKEYEPGTDDESVTSSNVAYDKMPWKSVVALASERGLFKPGMTKKEVMKLLAEADEQGT